MHVAVTFLIRNTKSECKRFKKNTIVTVMCHLVRKAKGTIYFFFLDVMILLIASIFLVILAW